MALFIAQCKARKLTAIKSIRVRMKSVEIAIEKYQQSELRVRNAMFVYIEKQF